MQFFYKFSTRNTVTSAGLFSDLTQQNMGKTRRWFIVSAWDFSPITVSFQLDYGCSMTCLSCHHFSSPSKPKTQKVLEKIWTSNHQEEFPKDINVKNENQKYKKRLFSYETEPNRPPWWEDDNEKILIAPSPVAFRGKIDLKIPLTLSSKGESPGLPNAFPLKIHFYHYESETKNGLTSGWLGPDKRLGRTWHIQAGKGRWNNPDTRIVK